MTLQERVSGAAVGSGWTQVAPGVFCVADTCQVYLLVADLPPGAGPHDLPTAVAVDFGSGRALDLLPELGISRVTDVLMTHHHRDQAQGLPRAHAHGARIHVPPVEVELFDRVDQMWRGRSLDNDYQLRDDRFSLLEPVPVTATVLEYRTVDYGGVRLRTVPTPGTRSGP
jgi:glyoxylase-like metal-dependent hydrolase (beta-lactamase superfamily II)